MISVGMLVLAACATPAPPEATTEPTNSPPESTAPLPEGSTEAAWAESRWFERSTIGRDLRLTSFDCAAVRKAAPAVDITGASTAGAVLCAVGGTEERPFIVAALGGRLDADADPPIVVVEFVLYEPGLAPDGSLERATTRLSGSIEFEPNTEVSPGSGISLLRAPTRDGDAIAIHYERTGGSRLWNEIEILGLNPYGTPAVVATWEGEGVQEATDGEGFVFTRHHYASDEGLCCPSRTAVIRLRPGPQGWTMTTQIRPRDEAEAEIAAMSAASREGRFEFPMWVS
jgi:hypothetical protein